MASVRLKTTQEVDISYENPIDEDGFPAPVPDGNIIWSSSDESVATVVPAFTEPIVGTVIAHATGQCDVRAQVEGTDVFGEAVHVEVMSKVATSLGVPTIGEVREQLQGWLVQPENLIHLGSFRVPPGLAYWGAGLTYCAEHDSLFGAETGNNYVTEISIVDPVLSDDLNVLPVAVQMQPFVDPTVGLIQNIANETGTPPIIGGLLIWKGKLIVNAYGYYDANATGQLSTMICSMNLSVPEASGPYVVGGYGAGRIGGPFARIPDSWRDDLGGSVVSGLCGIPIVTRTSMGPTAFSYNPDEIGDEVSTHPLIYYPNVAGPLYDYAANLQSDLFNRLSRVRGIVMCPEESDSVLFFGDTGLGVPCYGTGEDCGDTMNTSKGDHAPPYVQYVWAYDVNDLADVYNGTKYYEDLRPYRYWAFNWGNIPTWGQTTLLGAAYDELTGRIWISQMRAGGDNSVIHVFMVSKDA